MIDKQCEKVPRTHRDNLSLDVKAIRANVDKEKNNFTPLTPSSKSLPKILKKGIKNATPEEILILAQFPEFLKVAINKMIREQEAKKPDLLKTVRVTIKRLLKK